MSHKRIFAVFFLIFCAHEVFGGVSYHYDVVDAYDAGSGTVSIDGPRVRVDFTRMKNKYCLVSSDRGKHFRLFGLSSRTYYVSTPDDVAPISIGFSRTSPKHAQNERVTVRTPGEHRKIEGFEARHVIADASWEIIFRDGDRTVPWPMNETWDAWVTDQVPQTLYDPPVAGHPELGEFVLSSVTTLKQGDKPSAKQTLTVSQVNTHAVFAAGFFDGPAGFQRVPSPAEDAEAIREHVKEMDRGH